MVTPRYISAGAEALRAHTNTLRILLAQRCCPTDGLTDEIIEATLHQLALMDSNLFQHHLGCGEREGRVVSTLVRRRSYGMSHGIGRSGDLTSDQPKAAGSSLIFQLTNAMMLDLVRQSGAGRTRAALVVPMATGMTLSLVMRTIANERVAAADPSTPPPHVVIWPRVDQKTALKSVEAAGLRPWPVPLRAAQCQAGVCEYAEAERTGRLVTVDRPHPYFLQVHVDDVRAAIEAAGGASRVVCVLSTTSCFAPRLPDDVVGIARLCAELDIAHIVNNAYGTQSRTIMAKLDAAQRLGRVDYFVQSGDKNFLVPVGGAIVCADNADRVARVAAVYAGRASAAPMLDLFITALSLGRRGMQRLWDRRYEVREDLVWRLRAFASRRGEVLIEESTRGNIASWGPCTTSSVCRRSQSAASDARGSYQGGEEGRSLPRSGALKRKLTPPPHSVKWLPRNDISMAVTMGSYGAQKAAARHCDADAATTPSETTTEAAARRRWSDAQALGAKLFRSGVTGLRVIAPQEGITKIAGCHFRNYGTHQDEAIPCPMLVLACGVGMTGEDVEELMRRLEAAWPAPGGDHH